MGSLGSLRSLGFLRKMGLIKTKEEIEKIRQSGRILSKIMDDLKRMVRPGLSTKELEERALFLMDKYGAKPAFKGYKTHKESSGYPTALCTSINHEVVHSPALPEKILQDGDIISIDCGVEYPAEHGCFTDMAITVPVGKIIPEAKKLIKATEKSLQLAIKQIRPGNNLSQVGSAVEKYIEDNGFSVVRDLVGHGVGTAVHEEPQIPNYATKQGEKFILRPGMVIAVEPMVNVGESDIEIGEDSFTFETSDGSLSAHFEHTILVTEKGCEVITK